MLGGQGAVPRKNYKGAIFMLQEASRYRTGSITASPPNWYFPVGEARGAALLMNGDPGPERNPRNQRSLLGLKEAFKPQHRDYDASFVDKQFSAARTGGSNQRRVEDLV